MSGKEKREQPVVQGVQGRRTKEAIERLGDLDQDSPHDHPPCPRESMPVHSWHSCSLGVLARVMCVECMLCGHVCV